MRLLANENTPGPVVETLRQRGHDVLWVRADAPGLHDEGVLARASEEERVLLTFDTDFGELAFRRHLPARCGIVLLRLQAPSPGALAPLVVAALESRDDWTGHFSVVRPNRIRTTPLPTS